MLTNLREVTTDQLIESVYTMKQYGFRLATITCTDTENAIDLLYQFDKLYVFHNIRLRLERGKRAPSISNIYFAAALVENEIQDLFGVQFYNLAIDFEGRFLLSERAPQTPFAKSHLPGIGLDVRVQEHGSDTSGQ